ncbi:stage II sporulation protein P [Clostridium algifaecis]|uniref:Stage II sporulation protein P n=1 Tax=Clostridium algifaecis TaxID=1472040 RepID=A0ABS4KSK5_9CLOT|nr:stage II sporulation protein P [Clostridium algifaecis]MBP2033025.1 stage II sporulation protein P [Clostridium algifaecis]
MNYRRINGKDNPKLEICILVISLIFVIILPYMVEASSYNNKVKGNMFYVEILNLAMPAVKATSFNEEDMAEDSFSLKNSNLALFQINTKNPMSILGREIAFLGTAFSNSSNDLNVSEFKLDNKQISKSSDSSKSNTQNDLNLPDKKVSVFDSSLKQSLDNKPDVFIYHTHTTESYKPGSPDNFDDTQNVCAVGDQLVSELNKYGISAINDKTVHDAEAYTQSYSRSAVTVDKYLKKYGDFKLIIDMHRDSVDDKSSITTRMNGENVAKFMLVMARKNPHFNKNMALANKILQVSENLYPGFTKGVCYYNYGTRYFNQDKSNNAILVEVGADINTTTECKASMKYLARIIAEVLNRK